ncbi:bifunctional DNA primase/polymerase [Candidatus Bathyarchaeota archaeon]|nr:bifunctional DNA primase/polymerase [Candidatus Bathyarchaeota archaeon]
MNDVIEAARDYWTLGLPVVPLKGKQPLVEWGRWQTEPQTEQDFNGFPWGEADGFAIICGSKAKNGLYFGAVDFDVKNVCQEAIEKGKQALKNMPVTQIEETPSKGLHYIYWAREKPKSISAYHNICGLELLGEGKLCIMVPSAGYRRLNDNNLTEVANLEVVFYDTLRRVGVKVEVEGWFNREKPIEGYKGSDPPCIKALIQGAAEGLRNETAIRLASYLLNFKGVSRTKAFDKLKAWNSRNRPPLPNREVEAILKSAETHGYIYGCDDPLLKANCKEAECPIQKGHKKIIRTPSAELPDGRLIEEAFDGKDVSFLVYDPKTGLTEQMEQIELEDCIYKPIKNPDVKNCLTLLPSMVEEYESEEKLFQEVIDFLNKWHESPNEFERKLDALYVFLTYVYDLLPRLPYRRALGPYGRGKSAWLDTVGSICYRPIILAGCDTDKAIVRRINLWRGTALIDEADFDKSSLYAFIVKILNIGYDRRLGHYTRADDINPQKTISYNVFGPKLLATREEFRDKALESRCLTFIAREKSKPMPLYRDKKFLVEAQALRNKLILWRFRKYNELKTKVESLETPEIEAELNVSSSRIKEVLAPLILLNLGFKEAINELAQELEAQIKASDPDWQLEEQFNEALSKILDWVTGQTGETGVLVSPREKTLFSFGEQDKETFQPYLRKEDEKTVIRVPLIKIAKTIFDDPNPDENELKSLNQKLSRIAKTRLGLKIIKSHGKRFVELPLTYRPVQPVQPVTLKRIKIIELDDSHPLERVEAPTEEEAIIEESSERAEGEGERKPGIRLGMLRWVGLTAKIPNVWAWKAVEFTRKCNRNLPMNLTFPDGTEIKVRGPLTWFLARIKALEHFGKMRKESSLTRDSTVPGCIGTGKPIPPNSCESCHGDLSCFDLPDFNVKLTQQFRKIIKVRKGLRYADINIYLCETPYRLTAQGQRALWRFVTSYILEHKANKKIFKQFFGVTDDWASFTIIKNDLEIVLNQILDLLTVKGHVFPCVETFRSSHKRFCHFNTGGLKK